MLTEILRLLCDTAATFLTTALLARFALQAARVGHRVWRSPFGLFVMSVTDWMVLPARRVIPAAWGYDTSSLLLAACWQLLNMVLLVWLTVGTIAVSPAPIIALLLLAALETAKVGLYMMIGVVLISAVFSWTNPRAPLAEVFNLLSRPWLSPLQRVIPPTGGFDLSPLVFVVLVQVGLIVIARLHGMALAGLLM